MSAALVIAVASCGIWALLLTARGGFWRAAERDDDEAAQPDDVDRWPCVAAVVPARNEVEVIGASMQSLLRQQYRGVFSVILVDDQSDDGTAQAARLGAREVGMEHRLSVLAGSPPPEGWTGKLWAVAQGIAQAQARAGPPEYVLLTDADIVHSTQSVQRLVTRMRSGNLVLASVMARLRCESLAERALIPAFVFFFQMLYPFAWVNRRRTAAAAGGCMLIRREALDAAGGVAAVRGELIDDCALARRLQAHGPIWLGLTDHVRSVRACARVADIRLMVARSAYAQLRYSPLLLAGVAVAMVLTFLAPPVLALAGSGLARSLGLAAWSAMAFAFQPMLRFYRRSPLWGPALPAIAALYLVFTFDSAVQHWRGRGGMWKGRAQALRSKA